MTHKKLRQGKKAATGHRLRALSDPGPWGADPAQDDQSQWAGVAPHSDRDGAWNVLDRNWETDLLASSGPTGGDSLTIESQRASERALHPDTAELAMLVRTDRQRRGIGQAMLQETVHVLHREGVSHLEAYIYPDNRKMQNALQKWSQTEELHNVTFRRSIEDGEMSYALNLESQPELVPPPVRAPPQRHHLEVFT